MAAAPAAEPSGIDLHLTNRYQAAWVEHTTRIAQRQNVVQIYLAVVGALYGFWFVHRKDVPNIDDFLLLAITGMTITCSALVWLHNRVMHRLTIFMTRCEKCASVSIRETDGEIDLFYLR